MALDLTYTAASSDLPAFFANWESDFAYSGNGNFNEVRDTTDQWVAGTSDGSSVIVNGDNYSGTPGVVDGTVDTLELGSNLTYGFAGDIWTQDPGLSVDMSEGTLTSTWDAAVTDMSQNGSLEGLYAYFAEQGTNQTGTDAGDTMLSFAGDDTFTGGLGDDTFVFADGWGHDVIEDLADAAGNDDTIDLQGVSGISGYLDLIFNHSNWWDSEGTLTICDGSNTLEISGYVGTDIFGLAYDGTILV